MLFLIVYILDRWYWNFI